MTKSALEPGRWLGVVFILSVIGCARGPDTAQRVYTYSVEADDSLERTHVAPGLGQRVDSLLSAFETQGFSGTVLIVQRQRILLSKGYGFSNKEARIRNSPATRFELSSLTKMFTAAAVLQLAAEGKLRLDDPLERHLGAFPAEKKTATIEHLASHTAGLVASTADVVGGSRDDFIAAVKSTPQETPPGTAYRYTNVGYSVLGALIEVKSGLRYEDYLRQRIFAPAGMRYPVFRNAVPANDTLVATGYGPPDDDGSNALQPYQWGSIGAGGVWTTMGDVYRWVDAVKRGKVIPTQFRQLLLTPPRPPSREAFGWHVYAATDTTRFRIEKGGGSDIFATQLLEFPEEQLVILWASNDLFKRWRQTLNREVPALILGTAR